MNDARRHAPAAARNQAAILEVLSSLLPAAARVLEIGSGTGQHATYFTEHAPGWCWQPTDAADENLVSIEAYRASAGPGFLPARKLDVRQLDWPEGRRDAVFAANVIHISPWEVAVALFERAPSVLEPGGLLVLYGPFRFSGRFTAESNAAFDARLRGEDPAWGVRDVDDLADQARKHGFEGPRVIPMPANNHVLVWALV